MRDGNTIKSTLRTLALFRSPGPCARSVEDARKGLCRKYGLTVSGRMLGLSFPEPWLSGSALHVSHWLVGTVAGFDEGDEDILEGRDDAFDTRDVKAPRLEEPSDLDRGSFPVRSDNV